MNDLPAFKISKIQLNAKGKNKITMLVKLTLNLVLTLCSKRKKTIVRTRFEFLAQHVNGLRHKKPKNNEFIDNGLENWALVNRTTS